jgi:DNA-binding transcriptional LysR family regulator
MKYPDPELLKVLIAFHESKNLIQAAERLNVSQPAVTQRLQRLQEQVNQPLYALEGRKKVLTHYGKAVYDLAKATFNSLESNFENLDRRYALPENVVLKVGGHKELVGFFSELLDFPGRIDHRQMSHEQAAAALENEEIDVVLSEKIFDSTNVISRKFLESPSRIIFYKKYFPAAMNFRDILENKNLLLKSPCATHRLEAEYIEKFCKGIGVKREDINNRAVFDDWYSILNFVEAGNGFAIVPGFIHSQSKDLKMVDIPHAVIQRSSYYAVFQKKLRKIDSFKKVLNFVMSSS